MYKVIESNGKYELVYSFGIYDTKFCAENNEAIFRNYGICIVSGKFNVMDNTSDWVLSNNDIYRLSVNPSNRVTPELFEMALAAANIEIDPDITKQVLQVIELLENKGYNATLDELMKIGRK